MSWLTVGELRKTMEGMDDNAPIEGRMTQRNSTSSTYEVRAFQSKDIFGRPTVVVHVTEPDSILD